MLAIKPVRNEADHKAALEEMEHLWGAEAGTPEADRLDVLATLVSAYEDTTSPIEAPDPVEAIRFYIDQGRMTQAELGRILGSRARASEILSRRRRLTLEMIWALHEQVGIPLESLMQPYAARSMKTRLHASRMAYVARYSQKAKARAIARMLSSARAKTKSGKTEVTAPDPGRRRPPHDSRSS
jgi:HTH-type transcriptional regulator / antitoxin HigA